MRIVYHFKIHSMTKEQRWQKINEMRAKIARLTTDLNKFGREFAKDYCGFEVGEKVIALGECAIVTGIFFDGDAHESNLSAIAVEFWVKNWDRPQERRNRQTLRPSKLLHGTKWSDVIKKIE